MAEDGEFEQLKKELEHKSNQIEDLRTQIEHHKAIVNSPDTHEASMQDAFNLNYDVSVTKTLPHVSHSNMHQSLHSTSMPTFNHNTQAPVSMITTSPSYNPINSYTPANANVEAVVKTFHNHVEDLQRKLKITTEMCAEQDSKYQKSFKDMEVKLRRAISSRDELLKLRQAESNNQQKLIDHLQLAFDKIEKDKTTVEEKLVVNTDLLNSKLKEINELSEKLLKFESQLDNVLSVMVPDLKKLQLDCITDVNQENIVKFLEKFVTCNQKEKDELTSQVKTLIAKIETSKSIYEERIKYEKDVLEIHYKEVIKGHVTNLETRNKNVEDLQEEIKNLNQILLNAESSHRKEVKRLSETADEGKDRFEAKVMKVENEKEEIRQNYSLVQNNFNALKNENGKLLLQMETLRKEIQKLNDENKNVENGMTALVSNNEHQKTLIHELQEKLQITKSNLHDEKMKLQDEVNQKSAQYQQLLLEEKKLKEKLKLVAATVEKDVQHEERQKYEKEIKEVKNVMDDYKSVLEKAKSDLELKDEIIAKNNNSVSELTYTLQVSNKKIDQLNKEIQSQEETLNVKENKIVTLLLELDEWKAKLDTAEKNEMQLAMQLESLNNTIGSYQKEIVMLEKKNIELLQNVDKSNFKSDFIQQEWDKIVSAVNNKNKEIESLQKEKKAIVKKLKQKHDTLKNCETRCKEFVEELNSLKEAYENLEKERGKLIERCGVAERELDGVHSERNELEAVVVQQEDTQKVERAKLLQRLKISEQDLVLLKSLLDNQKSSDQKAVKVASITQKVVTKQRSELDSLKTKLQWMKEALDVSETIRKDVELQAADKDKCISLFKNDILSLSSQNKQLKLRVEKYRNESDRLHRALEQAAIKYEDVYSLVEKQEMVLKRERESYSAEIETLKKHLSSRTLQKYFVPHNESVNTEAVNHGEHLRHLLHNVRDMLSSTLDEMKYTPGTRGEISEEAVKKKLEHDFLHDQSDESRKSIVIVTPATGRNTLKLNEYIERHSEATDMSSAVDLTKYRNIENDRRAKRITTTSSPINDLNSVSTIEANFVADSTLSSISDKVLLSEPLTEKEVATSLGNLDAVSRLQQKLSNLKDMGTNLTSNNKELTSMMKKHSNNLRKFQDGMA